MPDSVWWLLGLLSVSAVGTWWLVLMERRRPSSYSRRQAARHLAGWRALPTSVQAACDDEALDAAEAEETAAAFLRTLYRP
ncbi:hypothetical protein AB0L55_36985 [Streptomyces anthocyanicus]|uniref:hypothetical protein n=1 Tax=Streptomyces anthocyanicus TaxID=68174 RepID=UPI0034459699